MRSRGIRLSLLGAVALTAVMAAAPLEAGAAIRTKLRFQTTTVSPGTVGTAVATCPRGWRAVSGGFQTSPLDLIGGTDFLVVHASRSTSPRRWLVAAAQLGSGNGTLTALAYCRQVPAGVQVRSAGKTVPAVGGASRTAKAVCPRGTRALGGGFKTSRAVSVPPLAGVFPWQSRRSGLSAWKVSGTAGAGNSAPRTLKSYAYCADAAPGVARRGSGTMATFGLPALATATCPAGKKPVGGGFLSPFDEDSGPLFYESARVPGRSWRAVALQGQSGMPPNPINSFAYCG
jgi:hypothetical protein